MESQSFDLTKRNSVPCTPLCLWSPSFQFHLILSLLQPPMAFACQLYLKPVAYLALAPWKMPFSKKSLSPFLFGSKWDELLRLALSGELGENFRY